MKTRLIAIVVILAFAASLTACATKDEDLKRLEAQVQQAMQILHAGREFQFFGSDAEAFGERGKIQNSCHI